MGAKRNGQNRTQKGCVAIDDHKNRIRLRWHHQGKRHCLYTGLPYNQAALKVAQQTASKIEFDMLAGHFDESLEAYGKKNKAEAGSQPVDASSPITVVDVFDQYTAHKARTVQSKTLWNYKGIANALEQYFGAKPNHTLTKDDVEEFVTWYKTTNLEPHIQRDRLVRLASAWDWAIGEGLVVGTNPWTGAAKFIKVPPKPHPKPFTQSEVVRILNAFRENQYYYYYAPYVEFLVSTGCRPSEAIGLQWKHITKDCSSVWIGSTLTRGERKGTKTNKERTLVLTTRLKALLQSLKPVNAKPDDLVFLTPNGNPIRDQDFCRRAWRTILCELGIPYRKPYYLRATFISHALEAGISPVTVASMTGHSVQVLYEHYAATIKAPVLPDIFS
jgi:integrase